MMQFKTVRQLLADNHGFTVDRFGNLPNCRYLVSPYKHAEKMFRFGMTGTEFRHWVKNHAHLLSRPGHYIGGWIDGGITYLDVSIETDSQEVAHRLAIDNFQLAYYDRTNGESIYVR